MVILLDSKLFQCMSSQKEIALSFKTVVKMVWKFKETDSTLDKAHPERPTIMDNETIKFIISTIPVSSERYQRNYAFC